MNEKQKAVLGTAVVAMMLAVLFFAPWRITSTDEVEWGPVYREPVSYGRSYASELHDRYYTYEEAEVDAGMLALQVLAIGAAGALAFVLCSDRATRPGAED